MERGSLTVNVAWQSAPDNPDAFKGKRAPRRPPTLSQVWTASGSLLARQPPEVLDLVLDDHGLKQALDCGTIFLHHLLYLLETVE